MLQADLPVSLDELALGATVTVMTPDGEAQVSIPAGTAPGRSLRLKAKRLAAEGKSRRSAVDPCTEAANVLVGRHERALLSKLRDQRSENPRHDWLRSAAL